jgi:elongation factor P--beta-lysine ligase
MLYKKFPFSNRFKRYQEIETKCIPSFDLQSNLMLQGINRKATPELADLFKRIFIINTNRRINFQELYDMKFL